MKVGSITLNSNKKQFNFFITLCTICTLLVDYFVSFNNNNKRFSFVWTTNHFHSYVKGFSSLRTFLYLVDVVVYNLTDHNFEYTI